MDIDIEDTAIIAAASFVKILVDYEKSRRRNQIHPYLQQRHTKGRFAKDFQDLAQSPAKFKENFRMEKHIFDHLLSILKPYLSPKKNSRPHDEITPKEKLAIVLEYLACGTLQRHIASVYRISKQHFGKILHEVCSAICTALADEIPSLTPTEMLDIGNEFNYKWQFPNCVGAIDGKHVSIKCPSNSGSIFFNYKGFYSIILMAVSDAHYRFVYLDIGGYGSEGDAGVFAHSTLGKSLFEGQLKFPHDATVGIQKLPYFFVSDDAFPLHKRIMKPFVPRKSATLEDEEAVFNYRLSRARRCVENSFGIMCSKFYCLARTMFCGPDRAQKIIAACSYLHNFLLRQNKEVYCPRNYADTYDDTGVLVEGEWRKHIPEGSLFTSQVQQSHGRTSNEAKYIRSALKDYLNSPTGAIPWQRKSMYLE